MLLVLEFWVGVSAVGILALFLWLLPRFAAISENLYFRLNNSLERDNHFIRKGDRRQLYRHYGLVARLRVLISNREAFGYLCVGAAMGILFGFAFVMMTLKGYGSAGHVYSVSTYLWMFAMSLDDMPRLVEQYSNLKDIGQRIEWSERNIKAGTWKMPSEHASDGISIRSANYITSARRLTSLANNFSTEASACKPMRWIRLCFS